MKRFKTNALISILVVTSFITTTNVTDSIQVYARNYVSQNLKLMQSKSYNKKTSHDTKHVTVVKALIKKDKQWLKENAVATEAVGLNKIGLKRINKIRARKGLKTIDSDKAVKVGNEVVFQNSPKVVVSSITSDIADLPKVVDNSELPYFPVIGEQQGGSCVSFSTTYYQATYMNAMEHDWDIKSNPDDSKIFSTKWTYNFLNKGNAMEGSEQSKAYQLFKEQGIATRKDVPETYSGTTHFSEWPTNPEVWKNAAKNKLDKLGQVSIPDDSDTPVTFSENGDVKGLDNIKQLLNDGYILSFSGGIKGAYMRTIKDNPNSHGDDNYVGEKAYYAELSTSDHAMVVVGYNDNIWVDINQNGKMDPGERGAFKLANSWGDSVPENRCNWICYDALNEVSFLKTPPIYDDDVSSTVRRKCFFEDNSLYWMTMKTSNTPKLLVQVDINSAHRNYLKYELGYSDDNGNKISWKPETLNADTGDYSFNGTTTASDGTVVLDYSNYVPSDLSSTKRKWYLQVTDGSKSATIKGFKFINPSASTQDLDPMSCSYQIDGTTVGLTDYKLVSPKNIGDTSNPTVISMDYGLNSNSQNTSTDSKTRVGVPRFSVPSGTYEENQKVSINCSTPGSVIRYTVDGTDPTKSSLVYTEPITTKGKTTIKAVAMKDGYADSYVESANYDIGSKAESPTFTPGSGSTCKSGDIIKITSDVPGAVIKYTMNGTDPTVSSSTYGNGIAVHGKMHIKAMVMKNGFANSDVVDAYYTAPSYIGDVTGDGIISYEDYEQLKRYVNGEITDFPNIDDDIWAGDVNGDGKIDATDVAIFKDYLEVKTNVCFPKECPTVPKGLNVTSTTATSISLSWQPSMIYEAQSQLKDYKVYRDGTFIGTTSTNSFTDNTVKEHTKYSYTVKAVNMVYNESDFSNALRVSTDDGPDKVRTLDFSVPSGTYKYMQKLSISCDTPGVIIRYTTDGTEPNKDSIVYDDKDQIVLHDKMTVKAIAMKDGFTNSAVATANYTAPSFVGDVNGDGKVNLADEILIKNYASGKITDFPKIDDDMWAGDVNGDGKIDNTDSELVKAHMNGNIEYFPKEKPTTPDNIVEQPPSVPSSISISWLPSKAVKTETIDHYEVYRDGKLIGTCKSEVYTDNTVTMSVKYSYTIVAVDSEGRKSDESKAFVVSTDGIG